MISLNFPDGFTRRLDASLVETVAEVLEKPSYRF